MVSLAERTADGKALRCGTLVHSRDNKGNTVVKVEGEGKVRGDEVGEMPDCLSR